MTWGRAEFALARLAFLGLVRRDSAVTDHFTASPGPATSTAPPLKPSETHTLPDLRARALRLHNRDPKAAARYLETHATLARGR